MKKIKSSLELALERTADIQVDKEAIKREELIQKGRGAAGRYLFSPESLLLPDELKSLTPEEQEWMKSGMVETLMANITLPRYESELSYYPKVAKALRDICNPEYSQLNDLDYILNQFAEFFKQYQDTLSQLEKQLRRQWEPRLRQKEQMHKEATGQTINLTIELDPEFAKTLGEEIARIDAEYTSLLNQGKEEIRKLV